MSLKVKFAVQPGPTSLYTFSTRLREYLESEGIQVFFVQDKREDEDVTLVFADQVALEDVNWSKPVILRCAGAYWDADVDFVSKNAKLREFHKRSNYVIYQSKFAKELSQVYLGQKTDNSVIYNGIKMPKLLPRSKKLHTPPQIAASAKWRPHKRLRDVIAAFEYAAAKRVNWQFWIGGIQNLDVSSELKLRMSSCGDADILSYLFSSDVFVYLSWIDPCPNSVVEALACGCPIVCTNWGGVSELVGPAGVVVQADRIDPSFKPVSYNNENKIPPVSASSIFDAICEVIRKYDEYKEKVCEQREFFDIRNIGKQYLEVLQNAVG